MELSREFDPTRVYRNDIAGGPLTESYENLGNYLHFLTNPVKNLVRNIFRPEQSNGGPLPPSFAPPQGQLGMNTAQRVLLAGSERPRISAAAMKRIEEQLGKDALDDQCGG